MANTDQPADDNAKKKGGKGGLVKLALAGFVFVGLGAGGAYGAYAAGLFGTAQDDGDDAPVFVRKGESDPFPLLGSDTDGDIAPIHGTGGSDYRTAYYSFSDSFTSNLSSSPALIQVDLAVSTQRDGRVLMWVKTHELALRSAILAVLAETPENEVFEAEGREDLSNRLTTAINAVLEEKEGFGGIDAVHFKGFLVQ